MIWYNSGNFQVMAYKNPPKDKEFKPGQSGNPKGKPPGTLSFKTIIRKWMEVEMDETDPKTGATKKMTLADIITLRQFQKAKRGDSRSFELLKNHIESLPKQGIDLTSAGESINQKTIIFKDYTKKEG